MGLLRKVFSSVVDETSRRVEESKKSAEEQRGKFAAQRAIEEESLPLVALLTFCDHEIRAWRGFDLSLSTVGGELLYQGQAGYFDLDRFEKRRNEGFIKRLGGAETGRIVSRKEDESMSTSYSLHIDGMPDQELRDVTKEMVLGFGDQVRYTFMSLEPMGWTFCSDTKESLLAMGQDGAPRRIWRVGYGKSITARIERANSHPSRAGYEAIIRCRSEVDLPALALVAIALAGAIDCA